MDDYLLVLMIYALAEQGCSCGGLVGHQIKNLYCVFVFALIFEQTSALWTEILVNLYTPSFRQTHGEAKGQSHKLDIGAYYFSRRFFCTDRFFLRASLSRASSCHRWGQKLCFRVETLQNCLKLAFLISNPKVLLPETPAHACVCTRGVKLCAQI